METFNEITNMMQAQGIVDPITQWYAQSSDLMQGKDQYEYEIVALEFYAQYMEDFAALQSGLGSSLDNLGVPGLQFGDGPTQSTSDLQDTAATMLKFAGLLRQITSEMKQELET